MTATFNLFVYGTLRTGGAAAAKLRDCARVEDASIAGTLYDIDGRFPALVMGGHGRVHGEVWRCPVEMLKQLDEYEGVEQRLFRRVAVQVGANACWTYAAGPLLARRLVPSCRVAGGRWAP
jgi:gamma-glutamylcyclotransferase (GGCT)/AIG2-like uncharacterized protein YtfP